MIPELEPVLAIDLERHKARINEEWVALQIFVRVFGAAYFAAIARPSDDSEYLFTLGKMELLGIKMPELNPAVGSNSIKPLFVFMDPESFYQIVIERLKEVAEGPYSQYGPKMSFLVKEAVRVHQERIGGDPHQILAYILAYNSNYQ